MGVLPIIWAKRPIEIVERGNEKGWLKIKRDCSDFLIGKIESNQSKKQKVVAAELEVYSTELNNELNGNVDNIRISQLKCQITK
jgi:hypothetical protein